MSIFGLMSLHSFMLVLVAESVAWSITVSVSAGGGDIHVHATRAAWEIPAVVAMAIAASICVWRSWLIMKSASFRAIQPVWAKRIHVL